MIIFEHRLNSRQKIINADHGIEIDLRSSRNGLMLSHDPSIEKNVLLKDIEKHIMGRKVIFNVKEEGLEENLMEYFNEIDRENSFILDETVPYIIKYCKKGFTNFALRVSDLESIETAININEYLSAFDVRIDWIWLDCFNLNAPEK